MARKRKLIESEPIGDLKCLGPNQNCPYLGRKSLRRNKRSRLSNPAFHTDSNGNFEYCSSLTTINGRYELRAITGSGGFGVVSKARDKQLDKMVAVKIIQNTFDSHADGVKEALTLRKIVQLDPKDERHCARLLDSFCYYGHICLVFDIYGDTLGKFQQRIRCAPYKLEEVRHIGHQLCSAVELLHSNGMTHNDIKPDNVLFENCELNASSVFGKNNFDVRLIDFGSVTTPTDTRDVGRTRFYSSPEYLLEETNGCGNDVWSIGCTLFEMYVGEMLFGSESQLEHLALIDKVCGKFPLSLVSISPYTFKSNGTVKLDGRTKAGRKVRSCLALEDHQKTQTKDEKVFFELLKSMLATDSEKRLGIKEVLKHEFFLHYSKAYPDEAKCEQKDSTADNCSCS